jgi:hypothetical protein
MIPCLRHNPGRPVSTRVSSDTFRVTCGDCRAFVGYHDQHTENSNRATRLDNEPKPKPPRKKRTKA